MNNIVKKILQTFLIIIILLLAMTGHNKLIYGYKLLIVLFATIPFFIVNNKKINIELQKSNILWIIIFVFFCISIFYTIDVKSTLYFLVIYLCGFSFIYHKFPDEFWSKFLKFLEIFTIVCAATIILEKFLPNIFNFLFGWFGNKVSSHYDSSLKGYFSGILFEGARAAFTMNIGIALVYSNILTNQGNKYYNISKFVVLFLALLLTGKRTLTAIGIILIIALFIIKFNKNKKAYKNLFIILGISIILLILLGIIVPDIIKPFKRMLDLGNNFGGRMKFWNTAIDMFKEAPIIGKGIGTFNKYLANQGFTYYGKLWTSYAHNSYLQVLGECGIIGLVLMLAMLIYPLVDSFKKLKEIKDYGLRSKLLVAIYIQLLFIIYALTGNPFHNFYEIYIYLIFVNFIIQTNKKKEIREKKNE